MKLRAFIDAHCGDGTLYSTPSEFVRDLLRQKKIQLDAESARDGILAGYRDAVDGRVVEYRGDLQSLLRKAVR